MESQSLTCMGLFRNTASIPPEALLSSSLITLGQSIKVQSETGAMDLAETYKYWDLFTWNLDIHVHNNNLSNEQANFIIKATSHPPRDRFELSFSIQCSQEEYVKKQLVCKGFFDTYLSSTGTSSAAKEFLDVAYFLAQFDITWHTDPSYKGFSKVLSVYLATTLRDTDRLPRGERKELRESAFFWGAMYMTQWSERHPSQSV